MCAAEVHVCLRERCSCLYKEDLLRGSQEGAWNQRDAETLGQRLEH